MTDATEAPHPAFRSPHAKWHEGLARRAEVITAIDSWRVADHIEWAHGASDDRKVITALVRFREPPPLWKWAITSAAALQAFRDALDHAVYAIACVHHRADPPPMAGALSFPITPDEKEWDRARKRLREVPEAATSIIRDSQPWETGSDALNWLQALSNKAKHRSLDLLSVAQPGGTSEITVVEGIEGFGPWLAPTGAVLGTEAWTPIGGAMADVPIPEETPINVGFTARHAFHDLDGSPEVGHVFAVVAAEVAAVLNRLQEALTTLTPRR